LTEYYFVRRNASAPEKIKTDIDLREIGVRRDVRSDELGLGV